MSVERVLLTNDDGIDAVGLRALYDGLSADYDVVTVAPTGDRSSAGRALSDGVDIADHELGYAAVDGSGRLRRRGARRAGPGRRRRGRGL